MTKPKPKHQPCPICMGKGYLPEYRYCHSCAKKEQFAWKRCTQCKATGVNLEHLLFTELKLPIKSTPRLRKGG